jgi:hypothetical protein
MGAPSEFFPTGHPEDIRDSISLESYHLSKEQLDLLERGIVTEALGQHGDDSDVVALAVKGNDELANFGRTTETKTFTGYDFHHAMQSYEPFTTFVYTVDLGLSRVAHIKRAVGPKPKCERDTTGLTGIEVVDDRLTTELAREWVDLQTALDHHGIGAADNCLNLTTNMANKEVEPSRDKPYSLMSYKAMFELGMAKGTTAFFAYLNRLAIKSLGRLDLQCDLLGGEEFHLPDPGSKTDYDQDYLAVVIPYNNHNINVFTVANPDKPFTKLIANHHVPLYFSQ